jgi:hypothetical protein
MFSPIPLHCSRDADGSRAREEASEMISAHMLAGAGMLPAQEEGEFW